jgi:hypothetical protein
LPWFGSRNSSSRLANLTWRNLLFVRQLAEDSTRAADIEQWGEYREDGGVRLIKIDEAAKESGS